MSTFKSRGGRRSFNREPQEKHRINRRIRVPQVRLITGDGEQLVMLTEEAQRRADEKGLDLVEVSPNAKPPVCKLMDYGKFKYKEQKKQAEAKKRRVELSVKEIRVRYRTDVGDLETKLKRARQFLSEGDKVKFSMRFRGREAMYMDLGKEKFDQIAESLSDVADIDDRSPRMGNSIFITFSPKKAKPEKK